MSELVVVGSVNVDLTLGVARLPAPGETVLTDARGLSRGPGGKGANQAVAAARLGASVALVACVGDDGDGRSVRRSLSEENIDVSGVREVEGPTGTAVVVIDDGAENVIVVAPGANASLSPRDVERSRLSGAAVTLLGLEVPLETTACAARRSPGLVVLNPAPAQPLSDELLRHLDVLLPNRIELAMMLDAPEPRSTDEVAALARRLEVRRGVIVTLGSDGALVVEGGAVTHVPAVPVDAVDTVGAGDAFCGTVAVALARSKGLVDAARLGARAGAIAAASIGAHAALPRFEELVPGDGPEPRR